MSQRRLTPDEIRFLEDALNADYTACDIRLREGEYQYDLAKAIVPFQLELFFPDVKDIIKKSYGEDKADDIQFIRKVQTILKKMERRKVVRILPKNKPWELQRYALSSFKFLDVDKNSVVLATDQQIEQARNLLNSLLSVQGKLLAKPSFTRTKIFLLVFAVVSSYGAIVWALMQPSINPVVFVPAFCVAVAFSILLGRVLSRE